MISKSKLAELEENGDKEFFQNNHPFYKSEEPTTLIGTGVVNHIVVFHKCQSLIDIKLTFDGKFHSPATQYPKIRFRSYRNIIWDIEIISLDEKGNEQSIALQIEFCPFCGKHFSYEGY